MLRKSAICLFVMLCALTARSPALAQDVFREHPYVGWASLAVNELMRIGILEGYPDGNFYGRRALTRDEYAAAMKRVSFTCGALYYEDKEKRSQITPQEREARLLKLAPNLYAPVPTDHWAYAAMRVLQRAGLWEDFGYSTSFDGNIELKRIAFATMLQLVSNSLAPPTLATQRKLTPDVIKALTSLQQEFRVEISAVETFAPKKQMPLR